MSLFISALGPSLETFLKFKNSIGIQYNASAQWCLKSLDRYNFKHGNSTVLCKSLVVGWSIERSEHSNSKCGPWISPVREFGRYLRSMGDLDAYDMNTQKHRRNRMILILLYDTGARVQELADLDIESLHLDVPNPYISIIGKGRKRRNVPIMRKTVAHLNSYLKEFHPSEQSAPLFYSMRDGKPHRLSTDSISLVVGTAAKMARETCNAVPENVHCHLFRKTKAMDLYKNGIPLPFIMQLLGHESMSTTSGFYAFATLEMMSDAINKSVPIIGGTEKLWKNKNAKQALYTLD